MKTTALVLCLAGVASAGLFPSSSKVKMLDAKDWKKTMSEEVRRSASACK